MDTIYFTSLCSPLKRRGSASSHGNPSQTQFPHDTLRRRLPTSPCTHWCQLCPSYWPSIIHYQQCQLTKRRCSSILWPSKCTKTRRWWRRSSTKPPWRSFKRQFTKPSRSSVYPFQDGMVCQPPIRDYRRKLTITRPNPITPVSATGNKRRQRPRNWARPLVRTCSRHSTDPCLSCFWTMPGLHPTRSQFCCTLSLTLNPPPVKTSSLPTTISIALRYCWGSPVLTTLITFEAFHNGSKGSPWIKLFPCYQPQD